MRKQEVLASILDTGTEIIVLTPGIVRDRYFTRPVRVADHLKGTDVCFVRCTFDLSGKPRLPGPPGRRLDS